MMNSRQSCIYTRGERESNPCHKNYCQASCFVYYEACCPGQLDSRYFPNRWGGKTSPKSWSAAPLASSISPRECVSADPAMSHFPDRTGLVSNGRWTDYWHPGLPRLKWIGARRLELEAAGATVVTALASWTRSVWLEWCGDMTTWTG